MHYDYDLIVIGAGSGGLAAAKRANTLGKRVAIAEKEKIGGTCVNRGCIPTKLMVYAAEFEKAQKQAQSYGWVNPEGLFDWKQFRHRVEEHVQTLRDTQAEKLEGIDILRGPATFTDDHTLSIRDMTFTAEYILIAVGSRPRLPDIRGIDRAITSRDIFKLDALPDSVLIVGGGYIGVEFSQILQSFGCRVSLAEASDHILDGFDTDIQKQVLNILEQDNVKTLTGARLQAIESNLGTLMATFDQGQSLKAQAVLCALGRTANIDSLGLMEAGVTRSQNKIKVDAQGRTSTPHIFAVGDCTDRIRLTPVARVEADVAISAMFEGEEKVVEYQWVPSAVFMHPEVAMVGLTEPEARDTLDKIEIYCETFSPLKYSITDHSIEATIKLVVNAKTGFIVGIHLVSPRAADIVQSLVPALKQGLTKADLDETVGIHPSVGEEIFAL